MLEKPIGFLETTKVSTTNCRVVGLYMLLPLQTWLEAREPWLDHVTDPTTCLVNPWQWLSHGV